MDFQQTTAHILMVRPAAFGFNPETAESNAFQTKDDTLAPEVIAQQGLEEFDQFVKVLRAAGVQVWVVEDPPQPRTTDAIFPNNWLSFHQDGTVITYPMESPNRRKERQESFIHYIAQHFEVRRRIHLEYFEDQGQMLEGTGSLLLDRVNRLAYSCLSSRTDEGLLDYFCERMGYRPITFSAFGPDGKAIYHTNVMLALGETFAVVCLASITDASERNSVVTTLRRTGKEVIEITLDQMLSFAGNMLQVKNAAGKTLLVMSSQAFSSLSAAQIEGIEQHTSILHSPIPTIERAGGGSVRCMMAEIFLPTLSDTSNG
jgi:hypothetical protein